MAGFRLEKMFGQKFDKINYRPVNIRPVGLDESSIRRVKIRRAKIRRVEKILLPIQKGVKALMTQD